MHRLQKDTGKLVENTSDRFIHYGLDFDYDVGTSQVDLLPKEVMDIFLRLFQNEESLVLFRLAGLTT